MQNSVALNKTIAEYKKKFYKMYHSAILPIFAQYEYERKNELLTFVIFVSIAIFAAVIAYHGMTKADAYGNYGYINIFSFLLFAISLVAILVLPSYFYNKFINKLKGDCMPQILKFFDNIHWFWKVPLIDDLELYDSELFSEYTQRTTDDSFSGNYKGVNFKISETCLENIVNNGKRSRRVTIFKGVVVKFDVNKLVRNKTLIATRGDMNIGPKSIFYSALCALAGLAACIVSDICHGYSLNTILCKLIFLIIILLGMAIKDFTNKEKKEILNEIKLEDPEFSKKYKAYSSDQIEGRYLITPAFMEQFKNIQTAFGTNKVKCSFYGNSLMFAISTNKNLFEIGNLFYNLNNPKQMEIFFNELTSIFMLVDYFKLNEKTGL